MAMKEISSSEGIQSEISWVIDLEKKLASKKGAVISEEEFQLKKQTIFRLPDFMRKANPEVFTPQLVAIGPYHHHQSHLQPLESHKERALLHFLESGNKPLGNYVSEIESVVGALQASYSDLDEEWKNKDNFIKLMITDGCFMLEVMRLDSDHCKQYAPSDPIFGLHALQHKVPYINKDMLILENQLPIMVLKKLISVQKGVNEEEAERMMMKLVIRFFVPSIYMDTSAFIEFTKTIHGCHALDIYRRSRLFIPSRCRLARRYPLPLVITSFARMRSSTRLREAGIRFRMSNYPALTAINFNSRRGVLTLPRISVGGSTAFEFLNMMAFEHLHAEADSQISSYVAFMNDMLQSAKDVKLLHRHGLIDNALGSDEELVRLFNSMSEEVTVGFGSLGLVQEGVENYCRKRFNYWRAKLVHASSSVASTASAIAILLSIISTVFAILQWKNG